MAFNNYLEDENDKPYFKMNSLAYYYDKMEGFAEKVEQAAKVLNVTKEEVEKNIAAYIEQNKNELDQRLAQWDGKLETFDSSVETLLSEWVDDGTLIHVIDSTLIDQKIVPLTAQLAETATKAEWLDIRVDFGAIGDGNTHPLSDKFGTLAEAQETYPFVTSLTQELDWAAFQKACNVVGKKKIKVPIGDFWINETVVGNDNTTIKFEGTVLEKVVGKSLLHFSGKKRITIIDPDINGDGAGTSYTAKQETIHFVNCTRIKIIGGGIQEIRGRSAILLYACTDFSISGINIDKYAYSGIMLLHGNKRGRIKDNDVTNCTNTTAPNVYPIMLSGYDQTIEYPVAEDIHCDSNFIDNEIPWWEGIDAHGGKNLKITNNTVKGCITGIALVSNGEGNYYVTDSLVENNTCIGNKIGASRNVSNVGISISGTYGLSKNIKVHNNTIEDFGFLTTSTSDLGGMKIQNVTNLDVDKNTIRNCLKYGIIGLGDLELANIMFNEITDISHSGDSFSYGIRLNSGRVYKDVIIERNKINWTGDSSREMVTGIGGPSSMSNVADTYILLKDNDIKVKTNIVSSNKYMLLLNDSVSPTTKATLIGKLGEKVYNTSPASGGSLGWVCTIPGNGVTGGTWKTFGQIA